MESASSGLRFRLRRALRQTEAQHRQLRELGAGLRRAIDSEDRDATREGFRRYREGVGAHFALEDAVLFPALHGLHPGRAADLERLGREHHGFLEALARLAALLEIELTAFAASFESLGMELAAHERREAEVVSSVTAGSPAA